MLSKLVYLPFSHKPPFSEPLKLGLGSPIITICERGRSNIDCDTAFGVVVIALATHRQTIFVLAW